MKRDWTEARSKCDREGKCRICGGGPVEAAHVIARSLGGGMTADSVVPLCRDHHRAFDAHQLDLLAHLHREEEIEAVAVLGLERARMRLLPSEYRPAGVANL